jgi:hypothetical protein
MKYSNSSCSIIALGVCFNYKNSSHVTEPEGPLMCSKSLPLVVVLSHINPVFSIASHLRSVLMLSPHLRVDLLRCLHTGFLGTRLL